VTETTVAPTSVTTSTDQAAPKRRGTGLSAMLLPELQKVASGLGISGAGKMRKSQLVDAIGAARSGSAAGTTDTGAPPTRTRSSVPKAVLASEARAAESAPTTASTAEPVVAPAPPETGEAGVSTPRRRNRRSGGADASAQGSAPIADTDAPAAEVTAPPAAAVEATGDQRVADGQNRSNGRNRSERNGIDRSGTVDRANNDRGNTNDRGNNNSGNNNGANDRGGNNNGNTDRSNNNGGNNGNTDRSNNNGGNNNGNTDRSSNNGGNNNGNDRYEDDEQGGARRGRRRRNRDRGRDRFGSTNSNAPQQRTNSRDRFDAPDTTVSDDDVLVPVAGIMDIMDSYAFVRTSGYLPGPNDVYVSLQMVRKYGLRKGDAVTGQVKQTGDNEQQGGGNQQRSRQEKFNPLVSIETLNGDDPEKGRQRPEFGKLTPLYPQDRLRLETEPNKLIGRIIDIVAPVGKGQRGLIVSPSKAGKTIILQQIANAITTNNPEVHLMVVLVDERPEEVTDMQRAVKGEVIASTFDRPAEDHTVVAELAIERAKRLVELGHDVVILLDSMTRLGRAYNLSAPASGRIMSGGVDSAALYPPKRFFGAARNIEHGGSLTILATALIDTGSRMDEVIFEEFKGTGNMELRLERRFAEKRIFPAIDVDASSTRREEQLRSKEELSVVWKLRRVLSGLDGQQALELLLDRLRKSGTNNEFLLQVQKTTPTMPGHDDE
jgi:transcription termination factor Rho